MLKSGQAAMEFLMTYGWAILAVLISIAALAYFGVLNPTKFLPQSCTLFPGIACTDVTVNNAGVSLVVQNGLGQNLNPFTISIPGCTPTSANNGLADGEKETVALPCNPFLITNSRFKSDIDITYTQPAPGVQHARKGSIVSQVENGYLLNSDFESGTSYWYFDIGCDSDVTPCGSGTCPASPPCAGIGSTDSTTLVSGSKSYKLDNSPVMNLNPQYNFIFYEFARFGLSTPLPVGTYSISFWAKASTPSNMQFALTGASWPSTDCQQVFSLTSNWEKYTIQCPTTVEITRLYFSYNPVGQILWIDDVEIKKA